MVSTVERTVVTRLLVFRFAFMVDIIRTFQQVKSRGTTSAIDQETQRRWRDKRDASSAAVCRD
jgi:hypothetical protein